MVQVETTARVFLLEALDFCLYPERETEHCSLPTYILVAIDYLIVNIYIQLLNNARIILEIIKRR